MNQAFGSGWGSLLWKEWRQQRAAALLLGLFCLVGYLGYCRAMGSDPEPTGWVLLLVLASASLGASVFAGESDDRTAGFLGRLPVSPWMTVLAKYAVALALVAVCALLPYLLMRPDLAEAFGGTFVADTWKLMDPLLSAAVAASVVVAMAGALAGSGLGAMATLLVTSVLVVFGAASCLVAGVRLSYFGLDQKFGLGIAIFIAWLLAHVWLLRTWTGRNRGRGRWRASIWAAIVVLAPAVCQSAILVADRLYMGPGYPALGHQTIVTPSPDGRTLAISAWRENSSVEGGWQSWLMDVDTGNWHRVGPWYQDCRFPAWYHDTTFWSPDGRWIRLHSSSVFLPRSLTYVEYLERVTESVWRLDGANAKPVRSWQRSGSASARWLGNGLLSTYAHDAWEFRNLETGAAKRCLHPPRDGSIDRQWHESPKRWLQDEIASVRVDEPNEAGVRMCRYWRTAPELARTERRDFPLTVDLPSEGFHLIASMDAKWAHLATEYQGNGPLWLVSLVDGECLVLGNVAKETRDRPFFTPDSSLFVVPRLESLEVWNLASRQREAPIQLPPVDLPPKLSPYQMNSIAAVSPGPPWRVVLSIGCSGSVQVVDLAKKTITEVFSSPLPEGCNAWPRRVSWLGNDRLLVELNSPYQLWVVDADGSNRRQVVP